MMRANFAVWANLLATFLVYFFIQAVKGETNLKWEEWRGCVLVDSLGNDGDSFRIKGPKGEQVVRLYFVDCPEIGDYFEEAPQRIREQASYFGVKRAILFQFAEAAQKFTNQALSHPFAVLTANEDARGITKDGRIFAFVRLWNGKDLGEEILKAGLGRAFGKSAAPPGRSIRDLWAKYDSAEWQARHARTGIWASSRSPLKKSKTKKRNFYETPKISSIPQKEKKPTNYTETPVP
ncbi:MAG: thermonuclease family protein [Chthoniobacterales bacterium]|nr:thermonuclease family protein [Chthoniobacterales bacterium]MCX7713097.1 thermonuclease family protein [Chthoniobacterales bacterium]